MSVLDNTTKIRRQCSVEGCDSLVSRRSFCWKHYYRIKRHGDPDHLQRVQKYDSSASCRVENCGRAILARSYCALHYSRWKKYGNPSVTKLPRVSWNNPDDLKQSLLRRRIIDPNGCWLWTGNPSDKYGTVMIDAEAFPVHRVSAALFNGFNIDSPLLIRHTCDVTRCFNPQHLIPGTVADNSRDMVERKRSLYGERSPHSKLTDDNVSEIKKRLEAGETQTSIASSYGVNQTLIGFIARGVAWKHIP